MGIRWVLDAKGIKMSCKQNKNNMSRVYLIKTINAKENLGFVMTRVL